MLELVESFTDKYSNVATFIASFIALIPFIFIFIKSMIKILGMTTIERLLTPRKEKSINIILEKIYISILIISYFNFFGYILSGFANRTLILWLIDILFFAFLIMSLLLFVVYLFKKTYKTLIVSFLASYTFLIFVIHIYFYTESENSFLFIFEEGYIAITLFYIILTWLLLSFINHILRKNNESKFRVKILRNREIDQTLENKYFHHAINKNIHVYTERYTDIVINEYYVYYINEDKLIIYFNDKSSTYRRNLF